ncbi:MAG TPA: RNA polymerase sigma factor [Spirochaetia bacterium]|nr:RNA polymerase sigma factor [Spirochaetales bacterium]HRY80037.1 RNA polymerase sigma factor [Spirochaetia bacterium]
MSGVLFNREEGFGPERIRALYDAAFTLLYRIAYRITGSEEAAQDVVHDSFERLMQKSIPFPSQDDAKYWLIRVVKNNALNWAKRKGREARAYERYFRESDEESSSAEDETLRRFTAEEVKEKLEMLPENLRMVLVLKEYGLLNYKEIGRVLGISEGNVKVRVFRAREALLSLFREGNRDVS